MIFEYGGSQLRVQKRGAYGVRRGLAALHTLRVDALHIHPEKGVNSAITVVADLRVGPRLRGGPAASGPHTQVCHYCVVVLFLKDHKSAPLYARGAVRAKV